MRDFLRFHSVATVDKNGCPFLCEASGHTLANSLAASRDQLTHQIDLAGKMMMDAGLADTDNLRDIGVAEAIVAAAYQKVSGGRQNVVRGGRKIAHAACLPSSRQIVNSKFRVCVSRLWKQSRSSKLRFPGSGVRSAPLHV